MNLEDLKKFDTQGMYKIYDEWPKMARDSFSTEYDILDVKEIDHVIFSGMGGSGTLGDVLSSIISKTDTHVTITKGYKLPKTIKSNTLVIATSVSGNTDETFFTLQSANKMDCKTIAFSSGGKIEEYCLKNKIEYRKVPEHHSPRTSLPVFLYTMLNVLSPILPIKKNEVVESIEMLSETKKLNSSLNFTETNTSLRLANWISGIPLIYYPWGLEAAAIRFKNSLQENAKSHVTIENIIEACHNNIVAWERESNMQPVLLQGNDDHTKTKERWNIIKQFFDEKNIDYFPLMSISGNILSKLITLIYLLDYSSIYKAAMIKIDPSPILPTDFVKKKL